MVLWWKNFCFSFASTMVFSMRLSLFLCIFSIYSLPIRSESPSSAPMCPHKSTLFYNNLQSRCSITYSAVSPRQVSPAVVDRIWTSRRENAYTSILFYASWCPFSQNARFKFEALSSMFPQIDHMVVEHSSASPSTFSRFGIHSLPTILMMKPTSRIRHRGKKDLDSLVKFYKRATGYEPVQYITLDQPSSLGNDDGFPVNSWTKIPLTETITSEPYLVLATLFLLLRVLRFVLPRVVYDVKRFWVSHRIHLKTGIFGETSQMMWTKVRLWKTRKFHGGGKSARVWASSLASVSLGKGSSSSSSSSSCSSSCS